MSECPTVARLVDVAIETLSRDELMAIMTGEVVAARQQIVDGLIEFAVAEEQAEILADLRGEFVAELRRRLQQ